MKRLILLLILTPSFQQLSAQFTLVELQEIRKTQLKALYCDSLILNREEKIKRQNKIIEAKNQKIFHYQEKEGIHNEQKIYYREQLKLRDEEINRLNKKNRALKLGCISIGSISLMATLLLISG